MYVERSRFLKIVRNRKRDQKCTTLCGGIGVNQFRVPPWFAECSLCFYAM